MRLNVSLLAIGRRLLKPRGKAESTPLSGGTRRDETAAHALDEPPADGETETSASILASRGRVRLREIVKEGFQFLRRNSDASVGDGKLDLAGLAGFRVPDCQHDLS